MFQYRERAEPFAAVWGQVLLLDCEQFQYRERAEPFAAFHMEQVGTDWKGSFNTAKGQNPLRHAQGNLVEQTEWQFQYRERAEPFAAA